MKFLPWTLYLVARTTFHLLLLLVVFEKPIFRDLTYLYETWVICIFECVMWIIWKIGYFMWKYSVWVKIRRSLLCVTSCCIKVTRKLIFPSVSILKFCLSCKSWVKLIFTNVIQLTLVTKRLLTVFKLITIMSE